MLPSVESASGSLLQEQPGLDFGIADDEYLLPEQPGTSSQGSKAAAKDAKVGSQ